MRRPYQVLLLSGFILGGFLAVMLPASSAQEPAGTNLPVASTTKATKPPSPGTYFAVVRVTNCGTCVDRKERQVTARLSEQKVAIRGIRAYALEYGFRHFVNVATVRATIPATPGYSVVGVRLPQTKNQGFEDLQVIINKDRTALELTAERIHPDLTTPKEGSEPTVELPLTVIEEQASEIEGPTELLTEGKEAIFDWGWATYSLPPIPSKLVRAKRKIDVEIRQAGKDGQSTLIVSERNIQLPWQGIAPCGRCAVGFYISQDGNQLRVSSTWLFP
jgi:hypothetical protein